MRYAYPYNLQPEPEGGYTITFPDVPGAISCADNAIEAARHAEDALVSILSVIVERREPLPAPSAARGRPVVTLHVIDAARLALHETMLAARIDDRELANRMAKDEAEIRCLRDLLRECRIEDVEAALLALGKRLEITIAQAA